MLYYLVLTLLAIGLVGGALDAASLISLPSAVSVSEKVEEHAEEKEDVHEPERIGVPGSAHEHTTFLIYIEGKQMNFTKEEYMLRAPHVHIENNYGAEIHVHATGIKFKHFFQTLNMTFNDECFGQYCNTGEKTLKFFVNGVPSQDFGEHLLAEGEKLLISYGDDSAEEIARQIASVPDIRSTIYPAPELDRTIPEA